jgi:hypothetical protein
MSEFYIFTTQVEADACVADLNGKKWFPIVGNCNGKPALENQQTLRWVDAPKEMKNGSYAVTKMQTSKLDQYGANLTDKSTIITAYDSKTQELSETDFVVEEYPEK